MSSRTSAPRRLARAALAAAAALTAALGVAPQPARAALLDEPPRLYTFKLDDSAAPSLSLLRIYRNVESERLGPLRRYLGGPWGRWGQEPWHTLLWGAQTDRTDAQPPTDPAPEPDLTGAAHILSGERLFGFEAQDIPPDFRVLPLAARPSSSWLGRLDPEWTSQNIVSTGASFASDGFGSLWAPPAKPVRDWRCRRKPVTFMRYGGEIDTFALVRCDGSVAPEAIDRISIMARPPEAPGPDGLLPDEPDYEAWEKKEWLPQIKLVHPRLLWVLQRVADAFPWRPVYIYSGYRPASAKPGSHSSRHASARAMDISVSGVSNVALFEICRKLEDVACGFYPNSKFVHMDVRGPGTGHAFWIDASGPGEPSRYVDSWPGVIMSGGLAWDGRFAEEQQRAAPTTPPAGASSCSKGPVGDEL